MPPAGRQHSKTDALAGVERLQLPSVGRSAPKISASASATAAEAQREAPTSHQYALH